MQVVATKGPVLEANEEVSGSLVTVSPFRQLICICVSIVVKILQFNALIAHGQVSISISWGQELSLEYWTKSVTYPWAEISMTTTLYKTIFTDVNVFRSSPFQVIQTKGSFPIKKVGKLGNWSKVEMAPPPLAGWELFWTWDFFVAEWPPTSFGNKLNMKNVGTKSTYMS